MNKFSELYVSYACAPKPCKWKHAFKRKLYMKYFKTQVEIHSGLPLERLFSHKIYPYVLSQNNKNRLYQKHSKRLQRRKKEGNIYRASHMWHCIKSVQVLFKFCNSPMGYLWLLTILQMMKCEIECPFLQGFSH